MKENAQSGPPAFKISPAAHVTAHVTVRKRSVFVFCSGGPGPSEAEGGGPLSERSKNLRPSRTSAEIALPQHSRIVFFVRAPTTEPALTPPFIPIRDCLLSVWCMLRAQVVRLAPPLGTLKRLRKRRCWHSTRRRTPRALWLEPALHSKCSLVLLCTERAAISDFLRARCR